MKTNSLDFDAQALREKILDLAMRGKLVKQDPNDEPASVLLEKIKADTTNKLSAKKTKKIKIESHSGEENLKYKIPDNWTWTKIGYLIYKLSDGAHKTPRYTSTGVPFLSVKDMSRGQIDFGNCKYISEEDHEILYKRCDPKKGDILLSKVGTTGVPALVDTEKKFDLFVSVALLKFNHNYIDPLYLKYLIESPIVQIQAKRNTRGVGNKNWVLRDIAGTVVPLPPLSEQSRIAAKIAQLFALLRKVESSNQQYAELQTLLKSKVLDLAMHGKLVEQDPNDEPASVLLEKIKAEKEQLIKEKKIKKSKPLPPISDEEEPFEIPDSWEWVRLGDIITLTSGKQLTKNRMNNNFQYSVFGANGKIGYFKEYNVNPNTILIGRVGSVGSINLTTGNTWATDNTLIVTPICKNNLSVVWLEYLLQFSNLKNLASRTSQPVISATKVGNVIIPFPPLSEQNRIATKIVQLLGLLRKDES
ncbi:restriction endonuclease subunit S [Lactobacillus taiwanensis]|uniref:restriction endonuclease subunit S n=1 Tax=Lactobacillus taiwanensis TaxID=508451 RepID=UPI0032205C6B